MMHIELYQLIDVKGLSRQIAELAWHSQTVSMFGLYTMRPCYQVLFEAIMMLCLLAQTSVPLVHSLVLSDLLAPAYVPGLSHRAHFPLPLIVHPPRLGEIPVVHNTYIK